jgi:putative ABC transport system permease protein
MRLYRLLLRLYPASFRAEYGSELCRLYAARRRNVSGPLSRLGLLVKDVLDVLSNAPAAHLDILRQDLRYAARTLRRAPGFAVTAVAVTSLGIGANTAVFSVTDHVLLRPLPYSDAPRLVKLWETGPSYSRNDVSPANYRDWRQLSTAFAEMGAYTSMSANLVGEGEPRRLEGAGVTSELLPLLGVRPVMGRIFLAEEDQEGAPGTVLLSYGLWQQVFGGSRDVLGKTARLNDETYTILGVLPQDFTFPSRSTQLWTPLRLGAEDYVDRNDNYLFVVGKLKPEVSLAQARAEMDLIGRRLERQHPRENARVGVNVIPLRDEVSPQARLLLAALFGASLCVLLIACTNLANLLLARALARRRELTVRAALGAGRERLVRQLLTESLVLAFLGGLLGVVLAAPAVPLLAVLVPTSLPIGPATALDLRVLGFAAGLTALTGIGFGVVPALRICRGADFSGLREGPRSGAGGARKRLRSALVAAEVAATLVLLVSAGLLIRALSRVQATDPGFRTEGVVTMRTPLPLPKYNGTARRADFYSRVLSEVRSLPGVTDAAYITDLPMLRRGGIWGITLQGETPEPNRPERNASLRYATSGFFDVLGIPLHLGRDLGDADTADSPFVAVVSESFVRRHWPGQDPLGKQFNVANADRIVVGVVGDIRVRGLERESEPQVYLPCTQVPDGAIIGYVPRELVYHASADAGSLVAAVRNIVAKADPELPVSDVRTLSSVVEAETEPRRTQLRALGAFAGLSLLLAGVGIYGLLSFAVSQRTSEIGVRVALGARPGNILAMVLREGLGLAALGGLAGALLAYAAGRSMEALLAGVRPGDAATFLAAACVVLLMTVSGSVAPALRALRVDPMTALRVE